MGGTYGPTGSATNINDRFQRGGEITVSGAGRVSIISPEAWRLSTKNVGELIPGLEFLLPKEGLMGLRALLTQLRRISPYR